MNQNILILTGAGISAESGIPTFRSGDDPFWGSDSFKFSTRNSLYTNRAETINFYNKRKKDYLEKNYKPNAAHYAISKLQNEYKNGNVCLVTQNVDNLHEIAGSYGIIKMHGCLFKKKRIDTGVVSYWGDEDLNPDLERPDIVLFGEEVKYETEIKTAMINCGTFIVIGTSLSVHPAAGFVDMIKTYNPSANAIYVNEEKCFGDEKFDTKIYGKSSENVPQIVNKILNNISF